MANRTTTRQINIRVRGDGTRELKKFSKGFGRIEKNTRASSKALESFRNVFAAAIAGFGARELVRVSDSVQLIRDRLKAFEGDRADEVFNNLADAASFTKTSVDNLGTTYARLRIATEELGLSSKETIGIVTALQQTFRLSGATLAETSGAAIQLAQGLGSGQLRGQELRSVLEANALFAGLLADELGTTRAQLIKFAEAGTITSERVVKALQDNFENLNKKAANLAPTIGQTLTVAFNNFKKQILAVNTSLGIASGFAKAVEFAINNSKTLFSIIGGFVASGAMLVLLNQTTLLSSAMLTFASGNVLSALTSGLFALDSAIVSTTVSISGLNVAIASVTFGVTLLIARWEKASVAIPLFFQGLKSDLLDGLAELSSAVARFYDALGLEGLADKARSEAKKFEAAATSTLLEIVKLNQSFLDLQNTTENYDISEYVTSLEKAKIQQIEGSANAKKYETALKNLNKRFRDGKINAAEYAVEASKIDLRQANEQFDKGKKRLEDLEKARDSVKLAKFNKRLGDGEVSLGEYNRKLREIEFQRVKRGFEQGTVSVQEFNKAALESKNTFEPRGALLVGLSDYIQSAGTLSSNIADAINDTFGRLEDSLVDFVKTGKFQFREFTQAILDDLTRIIIRQTIVNSLAKGIFAGVSNSKTKTTQITSETGLGSGSVNRVAAKGAAFGPGGEITAFANGGIVSSPTLFGFGNKQLGMMGEAGKEAILPLKRGSQGDLGVEAAPSNVTVNVINNTGDSSEVTQRESEDQFGNKTLDIIINKKVNDGFASGQFDKTMREIYGLKRRGR